MSKILYNLFLKLYQAGIKFSAKNGNKADRWLKGREHIFETLKMSLYPTEKRIWIHCASLGEFEQGRPLIEKLKNKHETLKVVLTFFSPSGYEIQKDYEYADHVFYLPMDGKTHAQQFIELVNPSFAIFVKYEFWYYYLVELKKQNIPTFLIAATFRNSQPFFKWYGGFFKEMLSCYNKIFVQDEQSKKLLSQINVSENVVVAGDTRYDRVAEIASQARSFPLIEQFKADDKLLIAGSTWRDDELLLKSFIDDLPDDWKLIIAPHEIDEVHLNEIEQLFEGSLVRYSSLTRDDIQKLTGKVLVIDNIGMLSGLYRYGEIAFVGGGFTKGGIHNVLEPAVFGLPVFFGPQYQKFIEAKKMVEQGLAFPVSNAVDLKTLLTRLIRVDSERTDLTEQIHSFIREQQGATDKIAKELDSLIQ